MSCLEEIVEFKCVHVFNVSQFKIHLCHYDVHLAVLAAVEDRYATCL